MRKIEDHKVNPANDLINILVKDKSGAGGANHKYTVEFPNAHYDVDINFQDGPIAEEG
jgi:hypothetical protein